MDTHDARLALADQGDNSDTRVTTNDGDAVAERVVGLASSLGNKGGRTDNVKSGDTKQTAHKKKTVRLLLCSTPKSKARHVGAAELTAWGQRHPSS